MHKTPPPRSDDPWPATAPADYWEQRYASRDQVWSGAANHVLTTVAAGLTPGTALDLGCGEGADVIWLARHGWKAIGIDISPTAVRRGEQAAHAAGVADGHAQFLVGDLAALPDATFDLVTSSFLHSPVELAREEILRRAARHVAPHGHLLITSHAAVPPWSDLPEDQHPVFASPAQQVEQFGLTSQEWDVVIAEVRPRLATRPDGEQDWIDDAVVFAQRR